jgi:hypothetical protein
MLTVTAPKKPALQDVFRLLCTILNTKGDATKQVVNSYIAKKTGIHALPAYHGSSDFTDEEKSDLYKEIMSAIRNDRLSDLGEVAAGQAVAAKAAPAPVVVEKAEKPKPPVPPRRVQPLEVEVPDDDEPVDVPAPAPAPVTATSTSGGDAVAGRLREVLREIVGQQQAQLDPEQIRRIVRKEVDDNLNGFTAEVAQALTSIGDEIRGKVDKYLAEIPPRNVCRIEIIDRAPVEVERQHYKFELLLKTMTAGVPALLVGPAGTGKTTAASVASRALTREFEAISIGPQTSKADIWGYRDANGQFHETATTRRLAAGGLLLYDELDAGHAGVLTQANMFLANGHYPSPDGMKEKHKDFLFVGAANTFGTGANRIYVGRNQLDAATLDRFGVIEWDCDEGLEAALIGIDKDSPHFDITAGGTPTPQDWMDYVHQVRHACDRLAIRHIVSPRAVLNGVALLNVGIGAKHVADMVIWKGMPEATRHKVMEGLS